jgi:hypothetical protein
MRTRTRTRWTSAKQELQLNCSGWPQRGCGLSEEPLRQRLPLHCNKRALQKVNRHLPVPALKLVRQLMTASGVPAPSLHPMSAPQLQLLLRPVAARAQSVRPPGILRRV